MSGTKFFGIPSLQRIESSRGVLHAAAAVTAGVSSVIYAQELNGFYGTLPATEVPTTLTQNVAWICEGLPLLKTSALEGGLPCLGIVALTTLFVYLVILAGRKTCGQRAGYERIKDPGEPSDESYCDKPSAEIIKTCSWYVGKSTLFAAAGAGTVLGIQAMSGAFKTKSAIEVSNGFVCSGTDLLKVTLLTLGGSTLLALLGALTLLAAWTVRCAVTPPPASVPGFDEEGLTTPRDRSRCCAC